MSQAILSLVDCFESIDCINILIESDCKTSELLKCERSIYFSFFRLALLKIYRIFPWNFAIDLSHGIISSVYYSLVFGGELSIQNEESTTMIQWKTAVSASSSSNCRYAVAIHSDLNKWQYATKTMKRKFSSPLVWKFVIQRKKKITKFGENLSWCWWRVRARPNFPSFLTQKLSTPTEWNESPNGKPIKTVRFGEMQKMSERMRKRAPSNF